MQQQCSRDGAKSSILSNDRPRIWGRKLITPSRFLADDVKLVSLVNGRANLVISTLFGDTHYSFDLGSHAHRCLSDIVAVLDAERPE